MASRRLLMEELKRQKKLMGVIKESRSGSYGVEFYLPNEKTGWEDLFRAEGDYSPEEPMVMYYRDGSGYPGSPASYEVYNIEYFDEENQAWVELDDEMIKHLQLDYTMDELAKEAEEAFFSQDNEPDDYDPPERDDFDESMTPEQPIEEIGTTGRFLHLKKFKLVNDKGNPIADIRFDPKVSLTDQYMVRNDIIDKITNYLFGKFKSKDNGIILKNKRKISDAPLKFELDVMVYQTGHTVNDVYYLEQAPSVSA